MPCEYSIYPGQSLVIERFTGITVREEFEAMVREIWKEPGWHKKMNILMDFRVSAMAYTPEDIKKLSQFFIASPDATEGRGAFLVSTPFETALSELFEQFISAHNRVATFSTWEAATAFLGVNMKDPFIQDEEDSDFS